LDREANGDGCGDLVDRAMPAACAVEMIHAYSLVHDDLPAMDDDDLRRGRPTCHKQFGEALAILAGDALLTLAFEVLARDVRPAELAARCCAQLAQAAGAIGLVGGQADDLACERERGEREGGDLAALEAIHRRKTGALFRVSLRLGAMLADAGAVQRAAQLAVQIAALDEYGARLGLAFQIVDDLLDVAGSESELGKRAGKDAGRGKLTFPGLLGVAESRRRAEQLVDEACAVLASFPGPTGMPQPPAALVSLVRYVLERNR
jgi:geranylgeranyl diphosphate synthase type II